MIIQDKEYFYGHYFVFIKELKLLKHFFIYQNEIDHNIKDYYMYKVLM